MEAVLQWITNTWNIVFNWLLNAWNTIDYWINRPVPVIGITFGCLAGMIFSIIWFIFKNTSFGKKAIRDLKTGYADISRKYEEFVVDVNNTNSKLKEFYEGQLTIVEAQKHEENKLLLLVAENSHNTKIKEALKDYRAKLNVASTNFDDYLAKKEKELREEIEREYQERYNDKLADLEKRLDELENEKIPEAEIEEGLEVEQYGEQQE